MTNPSPHKNQLRMLAAIDHYCRELAGSLDVVVTGIWTDLFDPDLPAERRRGREPQWNTPHALPTPPGPSGCSPTSCG